MDTEALLRRVAEIVSAAPPAGTTAGRQDRAGAGNSNGARIGTFDGNGIGSGGRIVALRVLPARDEVTVPLPTDLPDVLAGRLELRGITRLYHHQAEALARTRTGQHVVVATGTASGKSLCYQLPILESALRDAENTALYLAPTKALARDQLRQLRGFRLPHVRAAVYDGDTPASERNAIRRTANVVLTNPDMLHVGILPGHRRWAEFLSRLRLVAIDECHVARGVFGSHVAAVLRRLLRLTDHYRTGPSGGTGPGGRAEPTFVLSSATIGNPGAHAHALTGLDVAEVIEDSSGAPRRAVALWSPPLRSASSSEIRASIRRSTLAETADVLAELVRARAGTLAFVKSRKGAEIIAAAARRRLGDEVGPTEVLAYRAGLLPHERRDVERGLMDGTVRGVAATDALELGVDIGGLDAVIIAGWPGTAASWWQQAGRAGRRDAEAAVVFVADDDPLDRYLLDHPEELFSRPLEHAVIDVTNEHVMSGHLRCAAAELPLRDAEPRLAPVHVAALTRRAVEAGDLRSRSGRWHLATARAPAPGVSLRTAAGGSVDVVDARSQALIGEVDHARAPRTVHEGAVYLHQGRPWRVRSLDLERGVALVDPDDGTTTTTPRSDTDIGVLSQRTSTAWGPCQLAFGDVEVTTHVHSYVRRAIFTGEQLGVEDLALSPQRLTTAALWLTLPAGVLAGLANGGRLASTGVPGAAHAAEHAAIGLLPLFAMCDRWDIGGVSTAHHRDTGGMTIFIYDAYPGGAGIAQRGYDTGDRLWRATQAAITRCPCADGCPSCIQSPKCGNGNEPLDKRGALVLLDAALSDAPTGD